MEHYVGHPVGGKRVFCSPLRKDEHPSCSYYYNQQGKLLFKDFANGFCGDVFAVVMQKFDCSLKDAINIIASDFNITSETVCVKTNVKAYTPTPTKRSKIGVKVRNFTKNDLKWWKKYHISEDTLRKFNVFSCEAVFLEGRVHTISEDSLVFGYYGGQSNGDLWRIYYPNNIVHRFLTNWPKSKIQGWDQLPESGKICVITKSMKDCMVFHELGIPACAPNSELFFLSPEQLEELHRRFKHIVVLWDNDRVGKHALYNIRKEHPELHCVVLPKGSKDISDYIRDNGIRNTKILCKQYLKYLQDNHLLQNGNN